RPDVERFLFHSPPAIWSRRDCQLLVTVGEITLIAHETIEFSLHRLAHGGKSAIDTDDRIGGGYHPLIGFKAERSSFGLAAARQVGGGGVKIDIGANMIEQDSDVWITQRRFDHGRVERSATDRVDV